MSSELIPLFGGDGENDRFGFGIGLGGHAGFDPVGGDQDNILHEAEFFKNPDQPGRGIGLGPVHPVAGGAGKGVVIVVPAFAHGEQTEQPVVPAGIGGFKGALSKGVADRVDRPSDVLVDKKANKSAPDQPPKRTEEHRLSEKTSGQSANGGGNEKTCEDPKPPRVVDGDNDGVFQKSRSVALDVRLKIVEDPSRVGVPETFQGAMGIFLFVRVGVVLNVSRRPVKGRALHGHGTADEEESF